MLKIGEFSKLSHLTVKALRFYEKEGLLAPVSVDKWTGYRYYETSQLFAAARIKSYRQLALSIDEIRAILKGADERKILEAHLLQLNAEKQLLDIRLSTLKHLLEDKEMKYKVTVKTIPEAIVYYSETRLAKFQDMMGWIPAQGAECLKLNPGLKCAEPHYEFCEYLDPEHFDEGILVRHNEAVTSVGKESANIKFKTLPETKVLSIFHKGAYEGIGEAYAFINKYAEENGYQATGPARECYIDGIWNKESVDDWLTEVQLPIA